MSEVLSPTDRELITAEIQRRTKKGWILISQTESSAQMKKPKRWSAIGLILGFLLLIVGVGIILLVLTLIDYLLQKEKIEFFTADELRAKLPKPPAPSPAEITPETKEN